MEFSDAAAAHDDDIGARVGGFAVRARDPAYAAGGEPGRSAPLGVDLVDKVLEVLRGLQLVKTPLGRADLRVPSRLGGRHGGVEHASHVLARAADVVSQHGGLAQGAELGTDRPTAYDAAARPQRE